MVKKHANNYELKIWPERKAKIPLQYNEVLLPVNSC